MKQNVRVYIKGYFFQINSSFSRGQDKEKKKMKTLQQISNFLRRLTSILEVHLAYKILCFLSFLVMLFQRNIKYPEEKIFP